MNTNKIFKGFKWRLEAKWKELYYYIVDRVWYRHNVLKIKTLSPNWTDADEKLIHAMFQILNDFMKDEEPKCSHTWNQNEDNKRVWATLNRLQNWWTNIRPNRENNINKYTYKVEQMFVRNDIKMMKQLVDVSPYMWT